MRLSPVNATQKYLDAIALRNCHTTASAVASIAAWVTIVAFPVIILITVIIDIISRCCCRHDASIVPYDEDSEIFRKKLGEQRELILESIAYLEGHPDRTIAYRDALAFFKESLTANGNRKLVKLPHFFHATRAEQNLDSILKTQTIFQNHAVRGFGAYISTQDEAGQVIGYGRYTLAIDEIAVQHMQAAFFVPNPESSWFQMGVNRLFGWKAASVWIRVESDIPVTPHVIAYIAYPKEEENTMQAERLSIQREHPWIKWMNRATSEKIAEVFKAVTKRILPDHWRPLQMGDLTEENRKLPPYAILQAGNG